MKQNLFVSVFVHKCFMMLNDVEYTTFKMFVTQMSNYLFIISFQLMFYKTLRYRLARPLVMTILTLRKSVKLDVIGMRSCVASLLTGIIVFLL